MDTVFDSECRPRAVGNASSSQGQWQATLCRARPSPGCNRSPMAGSSNAPLETHHWWLPSQPRDRSTPEGCGVPHRADGYGLYEGSETYDLHVRRGCTPEVAA